MPSSRIMDWFLFGALFCWGAVGLTRAFAYHARGVRVVSADRRRTASQIMTDLLAFACLLVWAYEVIAHAWSIPFHVGPAGLHGVWRSHAAIQFLGAALVSLSLCLYAIALHQLGTSWRMGIDRETPGPLVTNGIYQWTRHPIYLAFDLMFAGAFLATGRPVFLMLALIWIPLMHAHMLREEAFLSERYGEAYRDYCERVGRYFNFRLFVRTCRQIIS